MSENDRMNVGEIDAHGIHEPVGSPPSAERGTNGRFTAGTTAGAATRFQPGNLASLRHGLRSVRAAAGLLPGQEQLRAAVAERRAGIVADLGGDLTIIAADEVDRYLELWVLRTTLWDLIEGQPVTSKGKRRAALSAYLDVVDRIDPLVRRLGMERKTKPVQSARDIMREYDRERA